MKKLVKNYRNVIFNNSVPLINSFLVSPYAKKYFQLSLKSKKRTPKVKSIDQIRASVIVYWLKLNNLRKL